MQNLDIAITETIHNSSVTAKDIAERMGKSHQVLLNKANPNNDTHHLTLHEAVAAIKITGNTAIIDALNNLFSSGEYARVTKQSSLFDALLIAIKESADISIVIHDAMADNKLTATEKQNIKREIREQREALIDLERAVDAIEIGKELKAV